MASRASAFRAVPIFTTADGCPLAPADVVVIIVPEQSEAVGGALRLAAGRPRDDRPIRLGKVFGGLEEAEALGGADGRLDDGGHRHLDDGARWFKVTVALLDIRVGRNMTGVWGH